MSEPTLKAQVLAVQRAAVNLRGHVENLARLVDQNKRPLAELEAARAWLPDLQAAAGTMEKLDAGEGSSK